MDAMLWSTVFSTLIYVIYLAVVITTIFIVILDNRNPVKTMAWILILFFLPVVGLLFYIFFGKSRRKERLISRKGYARLTKRPMEAYQSQAALKEGIEGKRLAIFFNKVNGALTFGGNGVEFYTNGYAMLQSLLREIAHARHFIHLEYYIFEDDPVGRLLRDALIDKALGEKGACRTKASTLMGSQIKEIEKKIEEEKNGNNKDKRDYIS